MNKRGNSRTPRWLSLISSIADSWHDGTRRTQSDNTDRSIMAVAVATLQKGLPLSARQKAALLESIKIRLGRHIEWEGEIRITHEQRRQATRTGKFQEIFDKIKASIDVKVLDKECESDVKVPPSALERDVNKGESANFTPFSQPFHSDFTSLSHPFHTHFTPFSQKRSNSVMPDSNLGALTILYDTELNDTDGRVSPSLNPSVLDVLPSASGSWDLNGAGSLAGPHLHQHPAPDPMIPLALQMRLHAQRTGQPLDESALAELEAVPATAAPVEDTRDHSDTSWMAPRDIIHAAQNGYLTEAQAQQALRTYRQALVQLPEFAALDQPEELPHTGPIPQGVVGRNPSIEISVWAGEHTVIARVDWNLSKFNVKFTRWDIVEDQLARKDHEDPSNRAFRLERYQQLGQHLRAEERATPAYRWGSDIKYAVSGLHRENDRERRGGLSHARVLLFLTWRGGNPHDITIWNGDEIHVIELQANTRMRSADAPNYKGKLKP